VKRIWEVELGKCTVCLNERMDLVVRIHHDWQGEVFVIQLECSQCHTVIEEELTRLRQRAAI
jgi:hypothetical protein